MANLTITVANTVKQTGASTTTATSGATLTAGVPIYVDAADANKIKPADANSGTVAVRTVAGITLHASLAGQPITYLTAGRLTLGATLAPGRVYVLSNSVGLIMPEEDLAIGDYCCILGYAESATTLFVDITNTATVVDA